MASEEKIDDSYSMSFCISLFKRKFPAVQNVTTDTLHKWIRDGADNVILLDSRPDEEINVSHLQGSIRVDPSASPEDVHKTLEILKERVMENDRPLQVVCYCSIGYRSSKYADAITRTTKQGDIKEPPFANMNVYNLEGSLFKWANEGRPMVDAADKPTVYAHAYSVMWGMALNSQLRKWGYEAQL